MSAVNTRRTAIVTGGTLGIGKEIARQLIGQGTDVLVIGRKQSNIDEALKSLRAGSGTGAGEVSGFAADVASEADIDAIVKDAMGRWGRIDVLINNAGIFDDETFLTLSKNSWDAVIAVNLTAPFLLTQRVGRAMAEQGGGSIVNLASIDGHRIDGTYPAYNVSKAGILHLTRQAAVELGPLGIRCNSVSPGWTRTPMVESALTSSQLEYMTRGFERAPLRRIVTPEEVANAVVFLASNAASGITGTDIVVDGGTIANLWLLETLPQADNLSPAGDPS